MTSWLAATCLYWQAAASIVATWHRSGTFAHGFAVVPISLYVIWTRRERLAALEASPHPWALPLLVLLGFAWLAGSLTNVLTLQQLAFVGALQVLAWAILGTQVSRALLFPLAFLFFCVPIGEELVPPLQDFTASFAAHALRVSGVLVRWEGRVLFTPGGEWHVAQACSGVRYLIPAVALGCLFSALTYRSWSRRVGFVLLCVAVPILANGVRAYGIIMLAYLTNNRIAVGVDHQIYGWFFFGVVMYPLFVLGSRWREGDVSSLSPERSGSGSRSVAAMILTAGCAVLLLAIAPAVARVSSYDRTGGVVVRAAAPFVQLPWRAVSDHVADWKPVYFGPAAEVLQTYRSADGAVDVYIAYYLREQQGAELVNSENQLANAKSWTTVRESQRPVVVDGQAIGVHETLLLSSEGMHRLVWSWYWVADEFTASALYAKLLQARAQLFGGSMGGAVIAIAAEYDTTPAHAAALLQDFMDRCAPWRATLGGFAGSGVHHAEGESPGPG
ncbi:MAG TPA: exosortase A [Candidatus Margulisiibacteriota bacterium]|nr:exosortase A [Candidatus Margulisiibacteriota bacterium]